MIFQGQTITGFYNDGFMALSFFVVVVASFQALSLVRRVIGLNAAASGPGEKGEDDCEKPLSV